MAANNLRLLLTKYYTRKRGQVLFKNKYSLNKLALEMWDENTDKGIEPSTISRVINGKRLFTYEQLKIFCTVLNIRGRAKKDLIKALQADYLKRSDLTISESERVDALLYESYQLKKAIKLGGLCILIGFYVILFFWWLFLFAYNINDSPLNTGFGVTYGLIPFIGGIARLFTISRLTISTTDYNKALVFLSLGLLTWFGGAIIWAWYSIFLKIEVAYPSWADISYLASWPLWLIGLIFLSKTNSLKINLKDNSNKYIMILLPLCTLLLEYYLLVITARHSILIAGDIIKIFLDFYYPFFDMTLIAFVLLLWRRFIFKSNHWSITLILLGFILNFIGDISLNYTSTVGTYENGGSIDFILATAMFFISLCVNTLDTNTV